MFSLQLTGLFLSGGAVTVDYKLYGTSCCRAGISYEPLNPLRYEAHV